MGFYVKVDWIKIWWVFLHYASAKDSHLILCFSISLWQTKSVKLPLTQSEEAVSVTNWFPYVHVDHQFKTRNCETVTHVVPVLKLEGKVHKFAGFAAQYFYWTRDIVARPESKWEEPYLHTCTVALFHCFCNMHQEKIDLNCLMVNTSNTRQDWKTLAVKDPGHYWKLSKTSLLTWCISTFA